MAKAQKYIVGGDFTTKKCMLGRGGHILSGIQLGWGKNIYWEWGGGQLGLRHHTLKEKLSCVCSKFENNATLCSIFQSKMELSVAKKLSCGLVGGGPS